MKSTLSTLLFCTTLLSGCASEYRHLKMYDDGVQLSQAPALVKPVAFVNIHAVDGKKVSISPNTFLTTVENELEFLPGRHLLEVSYNSGSRVSQGTLPFQIRVESDRRYIIRPRVIENKWRPVLIDVTDRPQCWTISVGTSIATMPLGPEGCDEFGQ